MRSCVTGQKKAEKTLDNGALRRGIGVGAPRLCMLVSDFAYFEGRLLLGILVATIEFVFPKKGRKERKIPTAHTKLVRRTGEEQEYCQNALLRSLGIVRACAGRREHLKLLFARAVPV